MKVLKFGGSSLATIEKIKEVASNIMSKLSQEKKLIIVASAMGKTTNELIEKIKSSATPVMPRELDQILATGEMQSVSLLANTLCGLGVRAKSLSGWQAGILTSENHSKATIFDIEKLKIASDLKKVDVVLVAGFQGISKDGSITTLGRGGSDTTAVALASSFGCDCEIYTDVDGVMTVDPRVFESAKKLDIVSYDEMIAMANSGAKVLETRCTEIAKKYCVNLYLGRSLEKEKGGTFIVAKDKKLEDMPIKNISVKDGLCTGSVVVGNENKLIILQKYLKSKMDIESISINNYLDKKIYNFYFKKEDIKTVEAILNYFKHNIKHNVCKISIVGSGVIERKNTLIEIVKVLKEKGIDFNFVSASDLSVSFAIDEKNKSIAIKSLAKQFEL